MHLSDQGIESIDITNATLGIKLGSCHHINSIICKRINEEKLHQHRVNWTTFIKFTKDWQYQPTIERCKRNIRISLSQSIKEMVILSIFMKIIYRRVFIDEFFYLKEEITSLYKLLQKIVNEETFYRCFLKISIYLKTKPGKDITEKSKFHTNSTNKLVRNILQRNCNSKSKIYENAGVNNYPL